MDKCLGGITLDLNKIPRPVKDAKFCDLPNPKRPTPVMNLFKTKRCRGWWPMTRKDEEGDIELVVGDKIFGNGIFYLHLLLISCLYYGHNLIDMQGKVEAELILMTREEAEKSPAGLGRAEPEPLPEPK